MNQIKMKKISVQTVTVPHPPKTNSGIDFFWTLIMVGSTKEQSNDSFILRWYLLLAWPTIWILSMSFSCSRSWQCLWTAVALLALYVFWLFVRIETPMCSWDRTSKLLAFSSKMTFVCRWLYCCTFLRGNILNSMG